jgi:hypothetical protein
MRLCRETSSSSCDGEPRRTARLSRCFLSPTVVSRPSLAVVVVLVAMASPAVAKSARHATRAERHALTLAVSRDQQLEIAPRSVSISTSAPGWALVIWDAKPYNFLAFRKEGAQWIPVGYLLKGSQPLDSVCAYAPSVVVTDLFGVRCPRYRALHARRAAPSVRNALTATLRADPYTRTLGPFRLGHACVSRLDPLWAAGAVGLTGTAQLAWFHRVGGHWHAIYAFQRLPPRVIILSLAACIPYDASEYGA